MFERAVAAVLTLLAVAAGAAGLPAGASAALAPTLTVNESGTAAGSTGSVRLAINFNQTAGDAVRNMTIALPPGLLINEEMDNGACLNAGGPTPPCEIGSGTAVIAGVTTPMALYLITPPSPTVNAGAQLVAGTLSIDRWQGNERVQLRMIDVASADPVERLRA